MAFFKAGSLTKENYVEWFNTIQGHATDSDIWNMVDPSGTGIHEEPKKPSFSDYKSTTTKFADLDDDEKPITKRTVLSIESKYRISSMKVG